MNADFEFACELDPGSGGAFGDLPVVRFAGHESLSELGKYTIVLLARSAATGVNPGGLIDKRAALRLRTQSEPACKIVHGLIVAARAYGSVPEGQLLEIQLVPGAARLSVNRRSRVFVDKSLRQIVDAVLSDHPRFSKDDGATISPDEGGPDYSVAKDVYAWRIAEPARLDDARARPLVIQYGESDLAFVSRLLEDEGIAYHFEHGHGQAIWVFSDSDGGRPRLPGDAVIGADIEGRSVKGFRRIARVRPMAVELDDYNWLRPTSDLRAKAGEEGELREFLFPLGHQDGPEKAELLARARLQRHQTEADVAIGNGGLRVLGAGSIFKLENAKPRNEGEYLVTELRLRGEHAGVLSAAPDNAANEPFEAEFHCVRRGDASGAHESRFRPALRTTRPHIKGTLSALVTAEPNSNAEINVGGPDGVDIGCVRVRFYFDTETARLDKEPSSTWLRVSDVFAGGGQGAVWHPRVGTEVLVAFEHGDPDRPVVVGRVYNGLNRPHRGGAPATSTLKSNSSPGGAVHNEITFVDTAGDELIYTNAGKDMVTDVANNRTESVGASATMNVGANDDETIGANRVQTIGSNDALTVGANDMLTVGAASTTSIAANCVAITGANQLHLVGASQTINVGAMQTELVGGAVTEAYGASQATQVAAAQTESVGATRVVTVAGSNKQDYGSAHLRLIAADRGVLVGGSLGTKVGGPWLSLVGGSVTTVVGGDETQTAGGPIIYMGPTVSASPASEGRFDTLGINVTGLSMSLTGMSSSKLGASLSLTGVSLSFTGPTKSTVGAALSLTGVSLHWSPFESEAQGCKAKIGFQIYF